MTIEEAKKILHNIKSDNENNSLKFNTMKLDARIQFEQRTLMSIADLQKRYASQNRAIDIIINKLEESEQIEKEHQELNGRLRQYIKELEEKVEKYRGNWED